MSSSTTDHDTSLPESQAGKWPHELPHGLLVPPPRVLEIVEREAQRFLREHNLRLDDESRQKMVNNITVQCYFYESMYEVAYRHTPQGPEVLAVGFDEIHALTKDMPEEEQDRIETWQD